MKEGWKVKKLGDVCYTKSSNIAQNKIMQLEGDYPIYGASGFIKNIDFYQQEKEYIAIVKDGSGIGKIMFLPPYSSIIGTLQYILPKDNVSIEFLAYILENLDLKEYSKGAAIPHIYFRDYSQTNICVPTSLSEQQRIIEILDNAFTKIDAVKQNAECNRDNIKELFQSVLNFEMQPKKNYSCYYLKDICSEIFAGGDAPKEFSEQKTKDYNIPIFANAVKDRGLYGYTNFARVNNPSITIAARGSGTGHIELRRKPYLPIVRLIVLIPNLDLIQLEFLKYSIGNLHIMHTGSAIPQLTVPMIKEYKIFVPSLEQQQQIVSKLDALSEKCKQLENSYQQTINDCDELKKAILAKAFNGEL